MRVGKNCMPTFLDSGNVIQSFRFDTTQVDTAWKHSWLKRALWSLYKNVSYLRAGNMSKLVHRLYTLHAFEYNSALFIRSGYELVASELWMILDRRKAYTYSLEICEPGHSAPNDLFSYLSHFFSILTVVFFHLPLAMNSFLNPSFLGNSISNNPSLQGISVNLFSATSLADRLVSWHLSAKF